MREILFKAKRIDNCKWVEGCYAECNGKTFIGIDISIGIDDIFEVFCTPLIRWLEVDPETICQFAGFCDKNGNKIWKNDFLMCHGNPKDLVKVLFGEFGVRNIETGSITDKAIGWYYEVVPTDAISRCEPFCWPMPLTKDYIDRCEMEVVGNIFDNPDLLQQELNE